MAPGEKPAVVTLSSSGMRAQGCADAHGKKNYDGRDRDARGSGTL